MIDRRSFLRASLAVACAPMIVRASSLMRLPVRRGLDMRSINGITRDENMQRVPPERLINGQFIV